MGRLLARLLGSLCLVTLVLSQVNEIAYQKLKVFSNLQTGDTFLPPFPVGLQLDLTCQTTGRKAFWFDRVNPRLDLATHRVETQPGLHSSVFTIKALSSSDDGRQLMCMRDGSSTRVDVELNVVDVPKDIKVNMNYNTGQLTCSASAMNSQLELCLFMDGREQNCQHSQVPAEDGPSTQTIVILDVNITRLKEQGQSSVFICRPQLRQNDAIESLSLAAIMHYQTLFKNTQKELGINVDRLRKRTTAGASTSTVKVITSTTRATTNSARASTSTIGATTSTTRATTSSARASKSTTRATTSTTRATTSTTRATTSTTRATTSTPKENLLLILIIVLLVIVVFVVLVTAIISIVLVRFIRKKKHPKTSNHPSRNSDAETRDPESAYGNLLPSLLKPVDTEKCQPALLRTGQDWVSDSGGSRASDSLADHSYYYPQITEEVKQQILADSVHWQSPNSRKDKVSVLTDYRTENHSYYYPNITDDVRRQILASVSWSGRDKASVSTENPRANHTFSNP